MNPSISKRRLRSFLTAILLVFVCSSCTKTIDTEMFQSCGECGGDGEIEHLFSADEICGTCGGKGSIIVPKKEQRTDWIKTLFGAAFILAICVIPFGISRLNDAEKVAYAEKELGRFCNLFTPVMIIDSNIWMDEDYDSFFECVRLACIRKNYEIELFGVQFDEIANIKKTSSYGEVRNRRARLAINRIEYLQKARLLRVVPVTVDAKRGAYADPLIVKVLASKSREGKECTLFTNDKELRVRARQVLSDYSEADYQIVEIANYMGTYEKIAEGYQIRIDQ